MLILFAALLLRAVIPAGYMPAAAGSDFLFEFCPEGIPASFMRSVAGDPGHKHGHMDHGDSGHDDHRCPVGHMLLSAIAGDDAWQAEAAPVLPALYTRQDDSFTNVSRTNYSSRDPPA